MIQGFGIVAARFRVGSKGVVTPGPGWGVLYVCSALTVGSSASADQWETIAGLSKRVQAFAVSDDGNQKRLYASGHFMRPTRRTGRHASIAQWTGSSWERIGLADGPQHGRPRDLRGLASFDFGEGERLIVGGDFSRINSVTSFHNLARWDQSTWRGVRNIREEVYCLAVGNVGGHEQLFAGGSFILARRTLSDRWSDLGPLDGRIYAMAEFERNGERLLCAGGAFVRIGGVEARSVAAWNGEEWSALPGLSGTVYSLATFDDGAGPALYAGGAIIILDQPERAHLAKWTGEAWVPVTGNGDPDGNVYSMKVFDDGDGPALFIGGDFRHVGDSSAKNLAKWDGSRLTEFERGVIGVVRALTEFDDGSGSALYVGGTIYSAGGQDAGPGVVRWKRP
ncbi:MAG: hypothetical protein FLDDKLPJ_02665 [Phycisphaerae bacterium]|nr:hypothetical protein [Phycisphaerae bacterium]